jgi:hypothetical protein
MKPPKLTRIRWQVMQIIKSNRRFQEREFLANEIGNELIKQSKRMKSYNCGPTMFSLEQAGWLERIEIQAATTGAFRLSSNLTAWRLTEKGKEVLDLLPDTQPSRYA